MGAQGAYTPKTAVSGPSSGPASSSSPRAARCRRRRATSGGWTSRGSTRVISDCHFRKTATEYYRKTGTKWLICTEKRQSDITLGSTPTGKRRRGWTAAAGRGALTACGTRTCPSASPSSSSAPSGWTKRRRQRAAIASPRARKMQRGCRS